MLNESEGEAPLESERQDYERRDPERPDRRSVRGSGRRSDDKFLCPNGECGGTSARLLSSRRSDERTAIVRRRECLTCGCRYNTVERIEKTRGRGRPPAKEKNPQIAPRVKN